MKNQGETRKFPVSYNSFHYEITMVQENILVVNNFHPETLTKMSKRYQLHHLWKLKKESRSDLIRSLSGQCKIAVTASWECDADVYKIDSLKLISAFGVGVDGIDFKQTEQLGIRVSNTPDVLNDAVAELAVGLMIASFRDMVTAHYFAKSNSWVEQTFPLGKLLKGKTLGIAGFGSIGASVVKRIKPFGVNVAYHNRRPLDGPYKYCHSLIELAEESDILLCLLPGGYETKNAINTPVLKALGSEGILINLGRGISVNEESLTRALLEKTIKLACVDVYQDEPNIPAPWRELDNVILLPHIGSATFETRRKMGELVLQNVEQFLMDEQLLSEVLR